MEDDNDSIKALRRHALAHPELGPVDGNLLQLHYFAQQLLAPKTEQSSRLLLFPREGFGSDYPCEQSFINDISFNETLSRAIPSVIYTPADACKLFLSNTLVKAAQLDARERLEDLLQKDAPETWDMPFKVFHDLDTLFFGGELHGRVYLYWSTNTDWNTESLLGLTIYAFARNARIIIKMKYTKDWSVLPANAIVGNLVHEMLHAWFSINCGTLYVEPHTHGVSWIKAVRHIKKFVDLPIDSSEFVDRPFPLHRGELSWAKEWRRKQYIQEFLGLPTTAAPGLDVIAARQNVCKVNTASIGYVYVL